MRLFIVIPLWWAVAVAVGALCGVASTTNNEGYNTLADKGSNAGIVASVNPSE